MKLVRYRDNPWKVLEGLQEEINKLFNFSPENFPALDEEISMPSVDVYEDKDNLYLEANLAGFEQKDIAVTLKNEVLAILAQKENSKEEKKEGYLRSERYQGKFYRELYLPVSVDEGKIKASYKNGVLKIVLPKKEEEKAKEIKIEVK